MIRAFATLLALASTFGSSAAAEPTAPNTQATAAPRLKIERLYSLPHLIGTAPTGFAWSRDSRALAFLWNDSGFNFRDVWTIDVHDPNLEPRRATRLPQTGRPDPDTFTDPLELARAEEVWELDDGASAVTWHPDGRRLLVTFQGDLWLVAPDLEVQRLTETDEPEIGAAYSPDGSTLAFVHRGEIWSTAAATDDPPHRLTALADEDLAITGFDWSPDSRRIALTLTDERNVTVRGIPDYLTEETEIRQVRRAYPGEEPVRQRLGVLAADAVDATAGAVDWIDWGEEEPDMILSSSWSPDGRYLAIDTSDLYAKERRIFVVVVENGGPLSPVLVASDLDPENETFYFWRIAWSTDSRQLYFLSDRIEDYHVWAIAIDPLEEPRQLTRGPWAVAEMVAVDGGLVVVGNRGRAEERQLFWIPDDGGEPVRLSSRPGTHMPTVSPDGRWAADYFSSQTMPPELFLTSLAATDRARANANPGNGHHSGVASEPFDASAPEVGPERRVTHSPLSEFADYRWVEAEFVSFPSHVDGTTLHGRLTLPPDFEPTRAYPAILGSVYTDSVRNQWGGRTAHPTWGLDQYLAQEGYILLNVDMRGSWGRGREHRRGIRLDYGGMDIEDLESGVRYLATLGYVDMQHVGIWGSSYGGLMTTMSLFRKPGLYAAGIAGAPATNVWHALTGQMAVMMRPQDQPAEYADSSPFVHAEGLEDPLMIIHGMRDQVVLYKDSVILLQRLILLGKDVDLVTLPNAGHGWDAEGLAQTRFAFGKMVEFFDLHLKIPSCPDS